MMKLETFEIRDHCKLSKHEIERIKENIKYNISVINKALAKGEDRYSSRYINSYESELTGMSFVCATIGLSAKTSYVEEKVSS